MVWKLSRQEDGVNWRETGETFVGSEADATAYAATRTTDDGWTYKVDAA